MFSAIYGICLILCKSEITGNFENTSQIRVILFTAHLIEKFALRRDTETRAQFTASAAWLTNRTNLRLRDLFCCVVFSLGTSIAVVWVCVWVLCMCEHGFQLVCGFYSHALSTTPLRHCIYLCLYLLTIRWYG